MGEKTGEEQRRGVYISGTIGSVGGDIVGHDKIVGTPSEVALDAALRPLMEAIKAAPDEARAQAMTKLVKLRQEAAKGKDHANDGMMAKLVDGLLSLVPSAAAAVVSAFAAPVLAGVAGPVTGFVLDKLRGK
jgi:hypothetical protein